MVDAIAKFEDEISIHSPRMGRDGAWESPCPYLLISIHSPRMGRDLIPARRFRGAGDFNPRSPHGERHRLKVVAV